MQFQLFGRKNEESPEEFWRETAARRGGDIGYMTYGMLLGRSGDAIIDLPGLVYTVGETVWFEDFERDNWLSKLMNRKGKYEKTEFSFPRADVTSVRLVSRGAAARCIAGSVTPDKLPRLSLLGRIFSSPVTQVNLLDGSAYFFDIMKRREFVALFATS